MEVRRSLQRQFIETQAAKETVLYANTASFLFDRLRKDSSAAYVAHELTTEEIVQLLRQKAKPENPLDLVWIYVLMAGLSLKRADEIKKVQDDLNGLSFAHVQWGDQLRTAILNNGPNTNVVKIRYGDGKKEYETRTNVGAGHVVVAGGS